jgi:hypothetical protein
MSYCKKIREIYIPTIKKINYLYIGYFYPGTKYSVPYSICSSSESQTNAEYYSINI